MVTADEINRYIHVEVMEKCWHRLDNPSCCQQMENALSADDKLKLMEHPDYCSDESPRSLLNEVVVRLRQQLMVEDLSKRVATVFENNGMPASAEKIARECVAAHQKYGLAFQQMNRNRALKQNES